MRKYLFMTCAVVLAAAAVHGQGVSPNHERGFDPAKAYAIDELDAVNVFNGNLNVRIPLGVRYPVGGAVSYQFALQYGGNNWIHQAWEVEDPTPPQGGDPIRYNLYDTSYPSPYDNAGMGWRLSFGRLLPGDEGCNQGWNPAYIGPDGAVHCFYSTLHEGDPPQNGRLYTRDGSYLRLKVMAGNEREIEFPDGTIHEFDLIPTHPVDGRVKKIKDRYGNWVAFDYNATGPDISIPTGWTAWRIQDSAGRTHYVHLKPATPYFDPSTQDPGPAPHEAVAELRLLAYAPPPGTNPTWATYELHYEGESDSSWAEILRGCTFAMQDPKLGWRAKVALLQRLDLPAAGTTPTESYHFTTHQGENSDCRASGALTSMTFPTKGRVDWTYVTRLFPSNAITQGPEPELDKTLRQFLSESAAVAKREITDLSGNVVSSRTYVSAFDPPIDVNSHPRELKVTISDYAGSGQAATLIRKSENFFSVCAFFCEAPYPTGEYGLPFTRKSRSGAISHTDGHGKYLSTIAYGPGQNAQWDQPLRATYVRYEADRDLTGATVLDLNRRVAAERTVYHDDPATPFTESVSESFDGLGHYRTTTRTAFGAALQLSTTNYNPSRGTFPGSFNQIDATDPWITHTYDFTVVTDGTTSHRTDYCFDSTGFLTRTKVQRGQNPGDDDFVTYFTDEVEGLRDGNVSLERYYFASAVPAACGEAPAAPAPFSISHGYAYGVRNSSQYVGVDFRSLDLRVQKSGLVTDAFDTAGFGTAFDYDLMGRIKQLSPFAMAPTTYTYTVPPGTAAPSVSVVQNDGTSKAARATYYYDHLGRMVQESRRMPGGWANTWTEYDALGRRAAVTVAAALATTDAHANAAGSRTTTAYDALGRVARVTAADGSQTTFAYQGDRITDRTSTVKMVNGSVAVTTREERNGLGQLMGVTENHGESDAQTTSYTYDLGNRLTTVSMGEQTRTFNYDGAGLLLSETHPESGQTTYEYDARGHQTRRTAQAGSELWFTYDAAERVTRIAGLNDAPLKEFVYDRRSQGGDYSMGKVASASRHNYHGQLAGGDLVVTEDYVYKGPGGRMSEKTTRLSTGQTFTDKYEHSNTGDLKAVEYPTCSACSSSIPSRKVESAFEYGMLRSVAGYTPADGLSYWPSGSLANVKHLNGDGTAGPLYAQELDAAGRLKSINISNYCNDFAVSSHPTPTIVNPGAWATLSVTASGATTYQWYRKTPSGDVPVGTGAQLPVAPLAAETYFVRVGNGTCFIDSKPATINVCGDSTITAPELVSASESVEASVPETPGATYQWQIINGTFEGSSNVRAIRFRAGCSGPVQLTATVTAACRTSTSTASVVVEQPTAVVSGSTEIQLGQPATIRVALTGVGPWKIRWSDQTSLQTVSVSPALRVVSPAVTTTYKLAEAEDASGCPAAIAGSAVVTVVTCPIDVYTRGGAYASSHGLASVAAVPNATYAWTVTNGTLVGASNGADIEFIMGCFGQTTLDVVVTVNGVQRCGKAVMGIIQSETWVRPGETITSGESAEISTTVVGVGPWTLFWDDGYQQTVTQSPTYRTVSPTTTTTYRIAGVLDASGCQGINRGEAVVTVLPPCPAAPAAIEMASSAFASVPVVAEVAMSEGAAYEWTIVNGFVTQGQGTHRIQFRPGCSGVATARVAITRSCGTRSYGERSVTISPQWLSVSGTTSINQGGSAVISASYGNGAPPWSITWSDGEQQFNIKEASITRTVTPATTTTYTVTDARNNHNCPVPVTGSALVTVGCVPVTPAFTAAPTSMMASATASASISVVSGASYAWQMTNGTITSGAGTPNVEFRAGCPGQPVTLTATVTTGCGASASASRTIPLETPASTVSGSTTIPAGSSATISATLTGIGPWSVQWSDQGAPTTVRSSPVTRSVTPAASTTYSLTVFSDAYGCAGVRTGSAVVTVVAAPASVGATAITPTRVDVVWTASEPADSYSVYRNNVLIGTATASPYSDLTATAGTAYLYRVEAVKSGIASRASMSDLATTVIFSNDPVTTGVTSIKAQHLGELRIAVNAVRTLAGLAPAAFTDSNLAGVTMKTAHVNELRSALDAARSTLLLSAVGYSHHPLTAGTVVRSAHVMEVRGGVK